MEVGAAILLFMKKLLASMVVVVLLLTLLRLLLLISLPVEVILSFLKSLFEHTSNQSLLDIVRTLMSCC